jgi:branched-chain amino acid transport system permease protein
MSAVIVNGFFVGLIYGLLGVGLVVVYRGSRVVNFAYGQTGMVAAMFFADFRFGQALYGGGGVDRGLLYTLPAAILIAAAIGVATELLVVRPLRSAPRVQAAVGTFAIGSFLYVFAYRRWGTQTRYASPLVRGDGIHLFGLQISAEQILVLIVTLVVLVVLYVLYRFTPFGLRLRAIALDPYAAGLVGVNVNWTSTLTWALAGAVAGLSAIIIAPLVAFDVIFMTALTVRGLACALVGGLTNIWATFLSGIMIAIVEGVIALETPVQGITDVAVAVFVLVLMMLRPSGLVRAKY